MKQFFTIFALFVTLASADVAHILEEYKTSTHPPPPHPYQFEYAAGRFPGHIDRTHAEVSDGSGTVKGAFSYVDPRGQVRSVEYVADEHGFYPTLSHEQSAPEETDAVKLATLRHYQLFNKIAAEHHSPEAVTEDDPVNKAARRRHFRLFKAIAAEHKRIGEIRALIAADQEAVRKEYYERKLKPAQ